MDEREAKTNRWRLQLLVRRDKRSYEELLLLPLPPHYLSEESSWERILVIESVPQSEEPGALLLGSARPFSMRALLETQQTAKEGGASLAGAPPRLFVLLRGTAVGGLTVS